MQSRTGNWMMALGAMIGVVGLSIMPAGLGPNSADRNMLGLGATIFSMGALSIALGIYLKALRLKSVPGSKPIQSAAPARPLRGGCDRCHVEMPVIQCKVHQQHLCGSCLAEHYDFRTCAYAPSTRKLGKAMAARAR